MLADRYGLPLTTASQVARAAYLKAGMAAAARKLVARRTDRKLVVEVAGFGGH